jgi:hypothetical protein
VQSQVLQVQGEVRGMQTLGSQVSLLQTHLAQLQSLTTQLQADVQQPHSQPARSGLAGLQPPAGLTQRKPDAARPVASTPARPEALHEVGRLSEDGGEAATPAEARRRGWGPSDGPGSRETGRLAPGSGKREAVGWSSDDTAEEEAAALMRESRLRWVVRLGWDRLRWVVRHRGGQC